MAPRAALQGEAPAAAARPPVRLPPPATPPTCSPRWLPGTAKFVALGCHARGTGTLQLYELDGAALGLAAEAEQRAALKCGCVLGGGGGGDASSTHQQLIALGNFDGQLQLVDAERLGSGGEPMWRVQAHAGIVNGLDAFGGQVCCWASFGSALLLTPWILHCRWHDAFVRTPRWARR